MAVTSGFFNSLYGDRKYTAEQFSALFNGLINDGVFSNIGTAFRVSATTENVISIGIGRAWFNGIWVNNDALLPMTCNDPEVLLDRIDALVIEINRSEAVRAGRIIFVKGTASGTPVNPTLTHDESVDQYPLAYIRRKAGVSEVVQADITNCIGTSACPYVTGILETQNIDSIVAQWESQFNLWFDGLQTELEGDVAANLASQIISLDMRFDELAKTRTVTVELEDSSLDTIEDSTGSAIYGSTVLESEGSGSIVVEKPSEEASIESQFKVGDTLTTVRTDLSDNWLLCNGAELSREEYPELSGASPITPTYKWTLEDINGATFNVTQAYTTKMIYGNGYYVKIGYAVEDGQKCGVILYSTDANGPWTLRVMKSMGGGSDTVALTDIAYANGYFVITGYDYQNSIEQGTARIWYATVPNSWDSKTLWQYNDGYAYVNFVRYLNGRFFVGGAQNTARSQCRYLIAYAATPNLSWVTKELYSSSQSSAGGIGITDMEYADGQYVALCSYEYYLQSTQFVSAILYGSSLEENWNYKTLLTTSSSTRRPSCIRYINGKYIVCSLIYNSAGYEIGISVFSDPSTMSSNDYFVLNNINLSHYDSKSEVKNIVEINGYIMFSVASGEFAYVVYSLIGDNYTADSFSQIAIATNITSNGATMTDTDSYLFVSSGTAHYSNNYFSHWFIDKRNVRLPSISLDSTAYTYIKARSE